MPEFLQPGVFVEEISLGPRPIEGVSTSTAAFLGSTERGPVTPRLVTGFDDYARWFGDAGGDAGFMPYAVRGFFENGGTRMYLCRIADAAATPAEATLGDFIVRAIGPGSWGRRIYVKIEASPRSSSSFRLRVAYYAMPPDGSPLDWFNDPTQGPAPSLAETFDDLEMNPESSDSWSRRLGESVLVTVDRKGETPPDAMPAPDFSQLSENGTDGAARPDVAAFEAGLTALAADPYRDVALVYAPGGSIAVNQAVIAHCEALRYRFAVIDADGDADVTALEPRSAIRDTGAAALYVPWIVVPDLATGGQKAVPPGGHVLGVYARTDAERGVFKAPANAVLRGVMDLAASIDNTAQDILNPRGVNAIRRFPGRGIRVWGARTLASDQQWKYVNVRRLLIFLERSIDQGTQWAVFEPNDENLWARMRDAVGTFLRAQWRAGALLGQKEEQAFFVACDRRTMTEDDIAGGRLICEIGVAPVRPAEFVILRIQQKTAVPDAG